jgi:uncharacterized protein (DUF885 family)
LKQGVNIANETHCYRRAEEWVDRLLALNPVLATDLGEHRWDDRLADFTAEGLERRHQELLDARAEVRRYTLTPTQLQCYLMGKLSILELVDEVRRARPGASLREIHDAILGCGSLPPRLMRQQLLG